MRFLLGVIAVVLTVCMHGGSSALENEPDSAALGRPRADLTSAELAAFDEGQRRFVEKMPGLGPLFNDESCGGCHFTPTQGGRGGVDAALLSEASVTGVLDGATDDDAFPDPEADHPYIDSLAAYVRGLAPVPRNGFDAAGAAVFRSFGCAGCHMPNMAPAMGVYSSF